MSHLTYNSTVLLALVMEAVAEYSGSRHNGLVQL